jgi:hypothetical protein
MFCPETFPIIEGHESIAASALVDTCRAVSVANAKGVLILVHYVANSNTNTALEVHEGETAAEAVAGTHVLTTGAEFPIWVITAAETANTWVRQTDGLGYTIDADVVTHCLVAFYIKADILTAGCHYVHLGSDTGGTGLMSVLYILDGERYQQTTPPEAIA